MQRAGCGIEPGCATPHDRHLMLFVEVRRPNRDPFLRRMPGEIVLREVGPVVRGSFVVVDNGDVAAIAATPQHLAGGSSRRARADDYNLAQALAGNMYGICGGKGVTLDLVAHDDAITAPLDAPAGHRVERRCAERFAVAQGETGMMPGTSHRVANQLTLGEWSAVVSTCRADREILG